MEMNTVEHILESNNLVGSRQLVEKIENEVEKKICDRTIRRYASTLGFKWGKPRPRSLLTEEIKRKRLEWCLKHRYEDWTRYIFSDEKFFRCGLAPVGMRFRSGTRPNFQTYRGPSWHIWNGINFNETFSILEVPQGMNADLYIALLSNALDEHFKQGMIFQQDNAPSHRSHVTKKWLKDNGYDCVDFPTYSPDLNPIENLWGIVSLEVRKRNPKTLNELKSFVSEEMGKVSRKTIQTLILSMSRRVEQCIERNGDYTDY
jgi:transposase